MNDTLSSVERRRRRLHESASAASTEGDAVDAADLGVLADLGLDDPELDEIPPLETTLADPEVLALLGEDAAMPLVETEDFLPIDDVALSGRPVVVVSEGVEDFGRQECEAVYKTTRAFDPVTLKWAPTSFWAVRNQAGARVPFEPVGYRPIP